MSAKPQTFGGLGGGAGVGGAARVMSGCPPNVGFVLSQYSNHAQYVCDLGKAT